MAAAQSEVDKLSKEAEDRHAVITKATQEANDALAQITAKTDIVSKKKVECGAMEKELISKKGVIQEKRDQAEQELATVQPLIDEAREAVSSIPSDAIAEIKSFQKPPPAVATVLEAVVRFMGTPDTSWKGMRSFLAQSNIMR